MKETNKLTDTEIKNAEPRNKTYKLFDGEGLYLFVNTSGSKYWRMRDTIEGKETVTTFGAYPKVSLTDARKRRDETLMVKKTVKKSIHNKESEMTNDEHYDFEMAFVRVFEAGYAAMKAQFAKEQRFFMRAMQ